MAPKDFDFLSGLQTYNPHVDEYLPPEVNERYIHYTNNFRVYPTDPWELLRSIRAELQDEMDAERIPNHLAEQRERAPDDYAHYYLTFEDYWERKLWHELTDSLLEYFKLPESASQRLPLFNVFIKSFADKINSLKLVQLGLSASTQCPTDEERLAFLKALAEKVKKPASQDAYVYATVAVASIYLELHQYDEARKKLDECEGALDTFDSVETVVLAAFYKTNAEYYKAKHDFTSYYRTALLYLACIDSADLPSTERQSRAFDLSIAALASEDIYNFGELLLHPILNSLTSTSASWLRDLLFAFNRGDIQAYDKLRGHIQENKLLKAKEEFLHQKISLAALTEAVFRRPASDRAMRFETIQRETGVQRDAIEHLVMKALSLGLLKGSIDQVDQVAHIKWVQPKVLDRQQIEGMRSRLREWDASVNGLGNWIERVGRDVWAA